MEERLNIVDDLGNIIGEDSRESIHRKGFWHKVAHVWVINSKNEILLQKRSMEKEANPGLWDISVGGHIPANENEISSAIRETEEELGLKIEASELNFVGVVKDEYIKDDYIDNEQLYIYVVRKDVKLSELHIQKEEVDEIKFVPLKIFKEMTADAGQILVARPDEYELMFKYLNV